MAKPTYDPSKQYTWNPSDTFTIKGSEFGPIINTIRAILSTPEAETVLWANRANIELNRILKEAVESGKAIELEKDGEEVKK